VSQWPPGLAGMFAPAPRALVSAHQRQIARDPWPGWGAGLAQDYPRALREAAAIQWAGRAAAEHGSVHQFAGALQVACEARLPLAITGALARLITDEVRHAELCGQMALTLWPGAARLPWAVPRAPWAAPPAAPAEGATPQAQLHWLGEALLVACCFGEALSVPMLQAIAVVATEPLAEAVAAQILRDEHLHARFGEEGLSLLLERGGDGLRGHLEGALPRTMGAFEASCCGDAALGASMEGDVLTVEIEAGEEGAPNLGTLTETQYAAIFYATMEQEIFPTLRRLGLDPAAAWARRVRPR
jgi:hypothetical protein